MRRKRPLTTPPPPGSNVFSVRSEGLVEANIHEREAWSIFIKWCAGVPDGRKVEMLKGDRVVAWLTSAGTRVSTVVRSKDVAPAADVV